MANDMQRPEGKLIGDALGLMRGRLSQRAAAEEAGISEGRWRQIVKGYQSAGGQHVPVEAPAQTLSRMARVVGVTPEQLDEAGRTDAADDLRSNISSRHMHPSQQTSDNPDPLPHVTDAVLIATLQTRLEGRMNAIHTLAEMMEKTNEQRDTAPITQAPASGADRQAMKRARAHTLRKDAAPGGQSPDDTGQDRR